MEKSKTLIWILSILLVVAIGGLGFLGYKFYALSKEKTDLEKEIEELKGESTADASPDETTASSDCASTLTDADTLAIRGWETYTNATQGYTFKYPAGWTVSSGEDEMVSLSDDSDGYNINLQFRSGRLSEFGIDTSYTLTSETTTTIACEDAAKNYYRSDDYFMITAIFDKNSTHHVIMMTYASDVGASISSDLGDEFDLILKTVAFTS